MPQMALIVALPPAPALIKPPHLQGGLWCTEVLKGRSLTHRVGCGQTHTKTGIDESARKEVPSPEAVKESVSSWR
jgi:hypothetical protein